MPPLLVGMAATLNCGGMGCGGARNRTWRLVRDARGRSRSGSSGSILYSGFIAVPSMVKPMGVAIRPPSISGASRLLPSLPSVESVAQPREQLVKIKKAEVLSG